MVKTAALLLAVSVGASVRANAWPSAPSTVDLHLAVAVAPEPVAAGGLLTYSIVMTNGGPGTALDAEMLELPSEDTTFESLEGPAADAGWVCTTPAAGARGKISCTNKFFAPGASVTFTIAARVGWCLGGLHVTSTAVASSATTETDPRDNTAIATSTIVDSGTCDDGSACTVGDHCAQGFGFVENFDLVEAPTLPDGWTATLVIGPAGAPTWRTNAVRFDTAPNAAFSSAAPDVRDSVLDSPEIRIASTTAQLSFMNRYDLEQDFDGGVLEIRIGDGPFVDILAAGGTFASGEYNATISELYGSPIHGRRAWTGSSDQFIPTTVNLPAAAAGQTIVLRWRMATDLNLGWVGQWIDSVFVTGRDQCHEGTPVVCDDGDVCTVDVCDQDAGCMHATISCDDGNNCTDDSCDRYLQCLHANNTAVCNDFDACTRTDRCRSGACVGGNPQVCRDADACTADSCDPALGCVATTANFDAAGFSTGRVDGRDLVVLAGAWSSCPGDPRYAAVADLDRREPCIDSVDFHLFMDAFGRTCGQ